MTTRLYDINDQTAKIEYYTPFGSKHLDAAVLILPGGGYSGLSAQEGEGYAGVFRLWGYHAFVLSYRLGSQGFRHPSMLDDVARAIRFIRSRHSEYGFDPEKIVIVGSSAGGHLAATLLTKWDDGNPDHEDAVERWSSRPNFGILCYPVITMGEHAHVGSRKNLLGENPSQELVDLLSAELHVTADTPPCFLWHTYDDAAVPVENVFLFASALRRSAVPFELHVYQEGVHGLGMKDGIPWVNDCMKWLARRLERPHQAAV